MRHKQRTARRHRAMKRHPEKASRFMEEIQYDEYRIREFLGAEKKARRHHKAMLKAVRKRDSRIAQERRHADKIASLFPDDTVDSPYGRHALPIYDSLARGKRDAASEKRDTEGEN